MTASRSQPTNETPSPLPWEVVAGTDHHGAYIVCASGLDVCDLYAMSNPNSLAICNGGDSRPVPFMDMDANARLIVEAVNSHAALVKALEMAEYALRKDSFCDAEKIQSARTTICSALSPHRSAKP